MQCNKDSLFSLFLLEFAVLLWSCCHPSQLQVVAHAVERPGLARDVRVRHVVEVVPVTPRRDMQLVEPLPRLLEPGSQSGPLNP